MVDSINLAIARLEQHCSSQGFSGFDPYDLKATKFGLLCQRNMALKYSFEIITNWFPDYFRRILKLSPKKNPKALGLFIQGYLFLWEVTGVSKYLDVARRLESDLFQLRSQNYHLSFGYPFKWQTNEQLYLPYFPNVASSIQCGLALIDLYRIERSEEIKAKIESLATFIETDLNKSYFKGQLFYSYSPADHYKVLNTNAQILGFWAHYSRFVDQRAFFPSVDDLVRTVCKFQNSDGSWPYRLDTNNSFVDNYHTAILLENIWKASRQFRKPELLQAFQLGLRYYNESLMYRGSIPLFRSNLAVPIDIHSASHAISLFLETNQIENCERVLGWTMENMWVDPYFGYRVYRPKENIPLSAKELCLQALFFRADDKSDYIRWSQAWMFSQLGKYLLRKAGCTSRFFD